MKHTTHKNVRTRSKRRPNTEAINRRLLAAALRVWELKNRGH